MGLPLPGPHGPWQALLEAQWTEEPEVPSPWQSSRFTTGIRWQARSRGTKQSWRSGERSQEGEAGRLLGNAGTRVLMPCRQDETAAVTGLRNHQEGLPIMLPRRRQGDRACFNENSLQ